jgi:hypothetical protein
MNWEYFILFAIAALVCWALGAFAAWKGTKPGWAYGFTFLGLAIFFSFIIGMWISLERPPMRTMGETRLWYSFFLPLAGLITYVRWKYKWILSFSCILSFVFICINIFKPEIHNKTLMPALQSPWFAPHVIVYMFAYAMLGAATVMAVYLLWFKKKKIERKEMDLCDATPSLVQSRTLKEMSRNGTLTEDYLNTLLTEEKPNQRQKFFLNQSDVQRYFPDTYTPEQMQNVIFHLLRSWEHKRTSRHRPQREDELER